MELNRENKVLVISNNAFSKHFNNGKTYESLFKGWSKENIAQLFFCTNEIPDFTFCENYFKISELDVFKSLIPFSKEQSVGGVLKVVDNKLDKCVATESKILKFFKKKAKTLALLRDLLWSFDTWKTTQLIDWIKDFKPEIIFYVGGDVGFTHEIVKWVSNEFNIPYVVYFTDDYVINQYSENFLQTIHNKIIIKKYDDTILNASKCYSIGDLMAEEYSLKYNKPFSTLVNCIDFNKNVNSYRDCRDKVIFSFIGGLHLNRWKSILELGELLRNLELSINIEFNIYSLNKPEPHILSLLNTSPLSYKGGLDSEMVLSKIKDSDILVHVESFDQKSRIATKYSISTKIPEYLSSNRCVLAYGPSEVASIRLINENDLGVALTDLDTNTVKSEKLKKLILDNHFRNQFGEKGFIYSREHFNGDIIRQTLRLDFQKINNKI